MLPELSPEGSVILALAVVITVTFGMLAVLMQLLGAILTLEFMALTGSTEEGDGGEQQGKAFHCRGI